MVKNKGGLSTVVATILLVLLSVIAVAIISGFLVPMVKKNLNSAGECLDVVGNIELNAAYTCYKSGEVQVSVETKKINVRGILISISGSGESFSKIIINNSAVDGVRMYGTNSNNLIVPAENEGRTYVITNNQIAVPGMVKIAPIIANEQCEVIDQLFLEECST